MFYTDRREKKVETDRDEHFGIEKVDEHFGIEEKVHTDSYAQKKVHTGMNSKKFTRDEFEKLHAAISYHGNANVVGK